MEAGGFAENYTASYFDVDFCLRLRRDYKKRIIYTPHSISLHHENQWDGEGGALADDNLNSEVVQAGTFLLLSLALCQLCIDFFWRRLESIHPGMDEVSGA